MTLQVSIGQAAGSVSWDASADYSSILLLQVVQSGSPYVLYALRFELLVDGGIQTVILLFSLLVLRVHSLISIVKVVFKVILSYQVDRSRLLARHFKRGGIPPMRIWIIEHYLVIRLRSIWSSLARSS